MKSIKNYIVESLKINSKSKVIRNNYEILFDSSEHDGDVFMDWMDSLSKKYPLFVLTKIPLENIKSEDDFKDFNNDPISIFYYCKNLLSLNRSNNHHYLIKLNDGHIEVEHVKNNNTYFIYILNYDGDDLFDAWNDNKISTETFVQDLLKYGIEKITK
jgi:hypothetical protein